MDAFDLYPRHQRSKGIKPPLQELQLLPFSEGQKSPGRRKPFALCRRTSALFKLVTGNKKVQFVPP